MKKILNLAKNVALALVVIVAIALFMGGGSGSDEKSASAPEKEPTEQAASEQEEEKESKDDAAKEEEEKAAVEEADEGPTIAKDSKYSVTIDSSRIVEDYDGAPCIAIDYTFTNVSDDSPTSMSLATNITVYQSGVECEEAWFADSNSDGYTNKVKAGVSVNVTRAYKLQNLTDDVEVEVAPLWSWNDDLLAYEVYQLNQN